MRRIAIWTAKGGTGKTTAALNLGAALALAGSRILLVDLDAQASLTRGLGIEPADGILGVMRGDGDFDALVQATKIERLDVVPGGPEMARAEKALVGEPGAEKLLDLALDRLPRRRWDVVILDCPPGVSIVSVGALVAAGEHLAPIDPTPYSVAGLSDALELAEAVRKRLNPKLSVSRILLSRVPRTRAARLTGEGLRGKLGDRVLRSEIPERAAVVDAAALRQPVVTFDAESPAAVAFRELAEEIHR
jgi:chromosome partitioning protein